MHQLSIYIHVTDFPFCVVDSVCILGCTDCQSLKRSSGAIFSQYCKTLPQYLLVALAVIVLKLILFR